MKKIAIVLTFLVSPALSLFAGSYDIEAIEVPHYVAPEVGGLGFTPDGAFGPFDGQAFVGDIAGDRILRCMIEEVDGVLQGAVVKFIDGGLGGGNNRLVFSPDGNSLYVGQTVRGWAKGLAEGLKRITYTGETPFEVQTIALQPDGFRLTFTKPLDPESAKQLANYSAKTYWYKSHHQYGSPKIDEHELPIERITVNGSEVTLLIPEIQADRIVELNLANALRAQDATPIGQGQICYTVRKLKR